MNQTIGILGRQPALGIAELESLFGSTAVKPVGKFAASVALPNSDIPFERLGGTIKICKLLTELPHTDWQKAVDYIADAIPQHLDSIPEGKIQFGLSMYGLPANPKSINASALRIKKVVKSAGRSIRVIPNNAQELNAAQILNNKLTSQNGMELNLISTGKSILLAQTVAVQDIDAYAARDQRRPKRDARVGMLPPKLAQLIINLANPKAGSTVLDPFCGTGVILQEAGIMGFNAYGSDLEERMVDYSKQNLEWLTSSFDVPSFAFTVEQGDATSHQWQQPFDAVACETYLGRPFTGPPRPNVLNEVMRDVDTIHKKFLRNMAKQTHPGLKLCIAVPAWKTNQGFKHLPVLDHLEEIGYTRTSFVHADKSELIYHRPDQIVARELVVLTRK